MILGANVFPKTDDPAELAEILAQKGYKAGYCPYGLTSKDTQRIAALRREFEKRNIVMAEVGAWSNPVSTDPEEKKKAIEYITDRLAVIHKGRIVELAETEKLFAHPLHPYTRALLSAIPMPDPVAERRKKLLVYDPSCHHYETDPPRWTEVEPGHFVLANTEEEERYRTEIADAAPEVM